MEITLKAARVNRNLTQDEAASLLGISKSTLQKYEAGKSYPDIPVLKSIEKTYRVKYSDLIFLPLENA